MQINIRPYRRSDCPKLAKLFYDTIHTVNASDYTNEQLNALADGRTDLIKWNASFMEHYTVVAVIDGEIAGFGAIDKTGYRIDHAVFDQICHDIES